MMLNVGCGPVRLPGEIGVDRFPTEACDVRGDLLALPFRDGSADAVRLDHVLEHQPQRTAVAALLEAYRVLRPGGRLRIGVPDLVATCAEYARTTDLADKALLLRNLYGSQAHPGEYHQSGWDAQTLHDLMVTCGFDEVIVAEDPERTEGTCIKGEAVRPLPQATCGVA